MCIRDRFFPNIEVKDTGERFVASKKAVNEGYVLQLERGKFDAVLHIKDTKTGERMEVRGKPGYEIAYDGKDELHQTLDRIGKAVNVADLMNGERVGINPKHPQGPTSLKVIQDLMKETKDQLRGNVKFTKSAKPGGRSSPHPARGLLVGSKRSTNDKVMELLLNNIGAGPFDGGCVIVAQALQMIHGGEIMALVRPDGIADHAVVQKGNTMYDFDGLGTPEEVISRFEKNEGARITDVRKLRITDLTDAPRNTKLAKQIANIMQEPIEAEVVDEGVNDPHIFKAVFLAGGPGSGKSFVAKNLLGGTGLRSINSDEVY